MANELQVVLDTGLSLTAALVQGGAVITAGIAVPETATPGLYSGDVPGGTAAGTYTVVMLLGGAAVAMGVLVWDGAAEAQAPEAPTAAANAAAVRSELAAELALVDAAVSTRSTYAGADTAGVTTLLGRVPGLVPVAADYSATRAAKLDNLDRAITLTATQTSVNAIPTGAAPAAATVATAVRAELATELARVDVAVSTREAESAASTRAGTGQAEHDATQAAIAALTAPPSTGAIAAAVRADVERTGGMLDLVPTLAEIEASTVLARQATVAAIPTTAAPTAAAVAAAVQSVLGTDFATIAAAVATRLAASGYTAPDNAGILAAISSMATAGDPLASAVPGAYGPGTAGFAVGRLIQVAGTGPVLPIPEAPPVGAGLCRVYGFLETPNNAPAANVKVIFTLDARGVAASERLVVGRTVTAVTNAAGQLVTSLTTPWVDLLRNDMLTPAGTAYLVDCEELKVRQHRVLLTSDTADLKALLTV